MTRPGARAIAAAAGLIADRVIGDPPTALHPVGWFGRAMNRVEQKTFADSRPAGIAYAGAGVGLGVAAGSVVRSTAAATWVATGSRSLHQVALAVASALGTGDLEVARALMPSLVGRDPETLDAGGIARATIESVAENTTDAIVAPALWAAAAGARGVLAHRAADTMDSMVGYRTEQYDRFGWASARLDDILAWGPARVGALLVILARPRRARPVVATIRRDAGAHPSPNAGVIEAAFAGALGIALGGPATYRGVVEHRPPVGDGRTPDAADIAEAVALSHEVTTALAAALVGYGLARSLPGRR